MDLCKSRFKVALTVFTFIAAQMIVYTGSARAQQTTGAAGDLNLVTSPLPIVLSAKPGTSVSADLRVKNGGARPERLRVDLLKFSAYGEEGKPRLLDPEPDDEQFKWVNLSQKSFDAEPNVWKNIKMTINVPKSAAFGYYYAVTFSRAGKEVTAGDLKTTVRGATAVLVLLEAISPNAKKELQIVKFESVKGIYEFLPSTLRVRMYNPGNIHLAPIGNIFITQGNKNIGNSGINSEKGNILPKSHRIYEAQWNDGFPHMAAKEKDGKVELDKNGKQIQGLEWNLGDIGKFRFGKYTANLLMVYDDGKRDIPLEASVSFWVIPWKFLLVATVVIGLILMGLWSTIKNIKHPFRRKRRR